MSESSGLLTSPQITNVSQLTNDSGYQTASQVTTAITGYGYQTAANVKSIVTSYGYQTASQVSSAITSSGATVWKAVGKTYTLSASTTSVQQSAMSGYCLYICKMTFTTALTLSSGESYTAISGSGSNMLVVDTSLAANSVRYALGANGRSDMDRYVNMINGYSSTIFLHIIITEVEPLDIEWHTSDSYF